MHIATYILILAVVTLLLRLIPFFFFRNESSVPPILVYLGKVLPSALIGMLVIYALGNTPVTQSPYGAPEAIAVLFLGTLYWFTRNGLLAIIAGTASYMVLIQTIL